MRVRWIDLTQGEANGYAVVSRQMQAALRASGIDVVEDSPDFNIGIGLPCEIDPDRYTDEGVPLIWHTMIEVDALPPGWADWLNRVSALWVPSTWVAVQFRNAGVTVPIFVAGYGVDGEAFYPRDIGPVGKRPMRWGVWADALRTRKHAELGVAAYLDASPVDSVLEVRLTDATAGPRWVDSNGAEIPGIRVLRGERPVAAIADWLRSLDALIYLSGGEGFGLMPFEAMACGVPVICAHNTGMADFLTPSNALLVLGATEEPAWTYTARFGPDYTPRQLLPDRREAAEVITWASFHRDTALPEIGRNAAITAHNAPWRATAAALCSFLEKPKWPGSEPGGVLGFPGKGQRAA